MKFTEEMLQEKARELADMVGSAVVEECLPIKTLELTADIMKEDYRKIRQAAEDIEKEQRAIEKMQQAAGKEGERGK